MPSQPHPTPRPRLSLPRPPLCSRRNQAPSTQTRSSSSQVPPWAGLQARVLVLPSSFARPEAQPKPGAPRMMHEPLHRPLGPPSPTLFLPALSLGLDLPASTLTLPPVPGPRPARPGPLPEARGRLACPWGDHTLCTSIVLSPELLPP